MVRSRTDCPARGLVAGGSLLVLAGALYLSARFATVTCAPGLPVPDPAGGCVSAPNLAFEAIGAAAAAAGLSALSASGLRAKERPQQPPPSGALRWPGCASAGGCARPAQVGSGSRRDAAGWELVADGRGYALRPRLPPFFLVVSWGIGVASSMRPILKPDLAMALIAACAPGPGVRGPVPPTARTLMWTAVMPLTLATSEAAEAERMAA